MIWIWDWWISQDDSWRGWWKHRGGLERDLKNCDLLSFCLETPKTIGMKVVNLVSWSLFLSDKKIIQKMNWEFSTQEGWGKFWESSPLGASCWRYCKPVGSSCFSMPDLKPSMKHHEKARQQATLENLSKYADSLGWENVWFFVLGKAIRWVYLLHMKIESSTQEIRWMNKTQQNQLC